MPGPTRFRLLLLLLALAACGTAQADIRRCVAADGRTIYTDRQCQDLGAVERLPDTHRAGSGRAYRYSCPRSLQDLVYQLTDAIGNRDVNRLASVYYWAGQSTRTGYALMRRLDAIAQRPLADIVPVYPVRAPVRAPVRNDMASTDASLDAASFKDDETPQDESSNSQSGNSGGSDNGLEYPQETVHQRPIGLRLEQTLTNGSTPARTFLGLHRAHGCWWVSL